LSKKTKSLLFGTLAVIGTGVLLVWLYLLPGILRTRLHDPDWHVRATTAELVGWTHIGDGEDILISQLNSERESSNVCASCIKSLVRLNSRKAEPVLIRIAADRQEDDYVRYCAIRALGSIGTRMCVDNLIELLSEPHLDSWGYDKPRPRQAVIDSLRAVTHQNIGNDEFQWRSWRSHSKL